MATTKLEFRAWDKIRKKMILPHDVPEVDPKNCGRLIYCDMENLAIGLDGQLYLVDECGNYEKANPNDYEIMRNTGLTDNHGKEIFEGDIIEIIGNWYENPELQKAKQ